MFLSQRNRENVFVGEHHGFRFCITKTEYKVDDRNRIYKGKM